MDLLPDGAQLVDTYLPTGDPISQGLAAEDRLWPRGAASYGVSEFLVYDTVNPSEPSQLLKVDFGVPYWAVRDVTPDSTQAIVSADNFGAMPLA